MLSLITCAAPYGNRVRVYEARIGAPLLRSVYINGEKGRKRLGHRDSPVDVQRHRSVVARRVRMWRPDPYPTFE
jgi:hypothetical protein